MYTSELYHYGVKGMRWGVRRYQPYNSNYTDQQRKRDQNVYSKRAVKRINERMNNGESIQSARSKEADRISKYRKASRVAGKVGKFAGAVGGTVAGYYLANKVLAKYGSSDPLVNFAISSAIMSGTSSAASYLGKYGSESIAMLLGGYNPNKKRE